MGDPFLGEIRLMSFDFAPKGWAQCDGQLLPVSQNNDLFSLLGITYGGNGQSDFALPNMKGRVPIHRSDAHPLGEAGGEEEHVLSVSQVPGMPSHTHTVFGSSDAGNAAAARGNYLGPGANMYASDGNRTTLHDGTVAGGSQAHDNMQEYLVMNFCVALQGRFPRR